MMHSDWAREKEWMKYHIDTDGELATHQSLIRFKQQILDSHFLRQFIWLPLPKIHQIALQLIALNAQRLQHIDTFLHRIFLASNLFTFHFDFFEDVTVGENRFNEFQQLVEDQRDFRQFAEINFLHTKECDKRSRVNLLMECGCAFP